MSVLSPEKQETKKEINLANFFGWKVIVLNDDHNTFEHVAESLALIIPNTSYKKGLEYASTIHLEGSAVVFTGLKEKADNYYSQLKSRGLTLAPLEKD